MLRCDSRDTLTVAHERFRWIGPLDSNLDPLPALGREKEAAASTDYIALPSVPNLLITSCSQDCP
jgi:hypothetical protein